MDKLDLKILLELTKNSRLPISKLSKKIKTSREVVNYRINNLISKKIILEFITDIDLELIGFKGAAIFLRIKGDIEEKFKNFLINSDFVSWVAELSGIWNFGFSIYGRSDSEIQEKFLELYNLFQEGIIDYRFALHKQSVFFYEKYFGGLGDNIIVNKNKDISLDKKDLIILKEISKNSRIDSIILSKKVNLTAPAIAQRIKSLEKLRVIKKYSLFVDLSKLNLFQYSIFIENKNPNQLSSLKNYLSNHKKVSFIADYIGSPKIEFGIIVENPYFLRGILQEIEKFFPDNKLFEISMFQKEFYSISPPSCIFNS